MITVTLMVITILFFQLHATSTDAAPGAVMAFSQRSRVGIFISGPLQTDAREKIYNYRPLFAKIERLTSSCADCGNDKIGKRRYCKDCETIEPVSRIHRCSKCKSVKIVEGVGCLACGSGNINPSVKVRPKDMRLFCERGGRACE
jgi:hypothetical protein